MPEGITVSKPIPLQDGQGYVAGAEITVQELCDAQLIAGCRNIVVQ
jgi:hypothetical protein